MLHIPIKASVGIYKELGLLREKQPQPQPEIILSRVYEETMRQPILRIINQEKGAHNAT